MKICCLQCEEELEFLENLDTTSCPSCDITFDLSGLREAECPICYTPFDELDTVIICADCLTPHHKECWDENHGCSTYGCASASHQEIHAEEELNINNSQPPPMGESDMGMSICPSCGKEVSSTDTVCTSCGMLLNVPDEKAISKKHVGAFFQNVIKNLILFFKDVGQCWKRFTPHLFHAYGEAFSKYGVFRGRTSRGDFLRYCVLSAVILFLLSSFKIGNILVGAYITLTFLPGLALTVRRLRDTGLTPIYLLAFPVLPLLLLVPTVETEEETTAKDSNIQPDADK